MINLFPGYEFVYSEVDKQYHNIYKGEDVGKGGYVYAEPGLYKNVVVLDTVSMHPSSIRALNMFGEYTKNFIDLLDARIAIKHKDYDILKTLLNGRLTSFVDLSLRDNPKFTLKDLSSGLKTALNSVYGLTSTKFDNPFKDPRNKNNIVALRGALFMVDLKYAVQEQGFKIIHIKTDSIKIPDATTEIIDFVFEFGKKYGYDFEHEETYSKFCLVNDAVYIAKIGWSIEEDKIGTWTAVGAQFAKPYVMKTLFTQEPIIFSDLCETMSVTTALWLDMNEDLESNEHQYHFVGKTGLFTPIREGCGGGILLRQKDDKFNAATGSKGYRWLESEVVKNLGKEDDVDMEYYYKLVNDAIKTIEQYGSFKWFVSDDMSEPIEAIDDPIGFNDQPPWLAPCGNDISCDECSLKNDCVLRDKLEKCSGNCLDCPRGQAKQCIDCPNPECFPF